MNVESSIETRKQAFFNAYEINDSELIDKINVLFSKIEEFGRSCNDVMDFETKFASSDLNQEYINLFTEIGSKCSPKVYNSEPVSVKSGASYIADDIASEVKYQADSLTQPMRHELYQETYDKARDIPVVGDVMNAKQHFDFFSRFKKKNDE